MNNPENRIVCAAIRRNKLGIVICGARHFDKLMRTIIDTLPGEEQGAWYSAKQGFVDIYGNFLTREEAWPIANGSITNGRKSSTRRRYELA